MQHSSQSQAISQALSPHGFLRLPEVMRVVPVSRATIWRWVSEGSFPKPIRLGPKTTGWRSADVMAWLAVRAAASNAKAA